MTRFERAIRAFWTIITGGNHSYADDRYCFIIGTKEHIVKNINQITELTVDEINQLNLLHEAKESLNA